MLTGLLCRLSWNEVDMWSLSQESGDYKQGVRDRTRSQRPLRLIHLEEPIPVSVVQDVSVALGVAATIFI